MKRVISSTSFSYPSEITHQVYSNTTYTYELEYEHEGGAGTHLGMPGAYYVGTKINGEPASSEEFDVVIYEIDVYPDGYVGYIWNGMLNTLGKLVGNKVAK